jgi:hypothetical protein
MYSSLSSSQARLDETLGPIGKQSLAFAIIPSIDLEI